MNSHFEHYIGKKSHSLVVFMPKSGIIASVIHGLRASSSPNASPSCSSLIHGRFFSNITTSNPGGSDQKPKEVVRASRLSSIKGAEQLAWAKSNGVSPPPTAPIAGSISKGYWRARQEAMNSIPKVPKILGFAGALPFLALTPMTATTLGYDHLIKETAEGQVAYGALIVSFLGAVHWGIAMTSVIQGHGAALAQRERYIWSVFPSLAAWPALMMEPAPGAACIALLLGICYMSDSAYGRNGSLPPWYMTLRGYLTTIAIFSMLSTSVFFLMRDFEKAKRRMAEEDKKREEERQARLEGRRTKALEEEKAKSKKWW